VDNEARNNTIRYNDVHDVTKLMSDGGGIYTLSRQPGTLIAENYVHDFVRLPTHGAFPIAGIYLDEGSNLITVQDNVIINTGDESIFQNGVGPSNTFANNDRESASTMAFAGLEPAYIDIRVPRPPPDTSPPNRSNGQPGSLLPSGTTQVDIGLLTDEPALCRYSTTSDSSFSSMSDTFTVTGGQSHTTLITDVSNGSAYTFYVRCQDAAGNVNHDDFVVSFAVSEGDTTARLVAAYSFDENSTTTAIDTSGNGHSGVLAGATWTTEGRFGGALSFDGVGDWVTVDSTELLNLTTSLTLEAWVFPVSLGPVWRNVVIKERPGGEVYNLYAHSEAGVPTAYFVSSSDPSTPVNVSGTGTLPVNDWSHLAVTYSDSVLRAYINGVLVDSRSVASPLTTSDGALRIGGNSIWGEFFAGRIDEVRIYDRALSAPDIQRDMNTQLP
jgi:hypothetical protein